MNWQSFCSVKQVLLVKDGMKMRILMAEDDPDDRFLLNEELKENKFEENIEIVNDGVELLDYLHQRGRYDAMSAPRPELIILDCIMPKMNGMETLEEIKSYKKFKDIPIVFLTSSKNEMDYYMDKNLDVISYLTKPISYGDIIEAVRYKYNIPLHDQS